MTSNAFRQPLSSALNIDGQERFDLAFLRRLLQAIDVRLQPLQEQQASAEDLLDNLQGLTLDRINNILTPAIQQVFELTSRGFLIANSATEATIAVGDVHTFIVGDETERELFTPSPFTALTRLGSTEDYGIARTVSYDQETGEYVCLVLSVYGSGGPHSDWVIGAMAGSTIAQHSLLVDAQALHDAIVERSNAAVDLAQDWAEKETAPDGPDTMSARTAAKLSTAAALAADKNRGDARAWAEGAGEPQGVAGAKSAKVWSEQSHAWAEGAEPGGAGTKSAKAHALDAGQKADAASDSALRAALYDGPKFNTIALMAANDALTDGKQCVVWDGFNGEPETFVYDAASELTADGALVVDAAGMGAGRLVSKRTNFATVADMLADRRTFAVGTKLTAAGFSYEATASTGNLGQTNAGGQELNVLLDDSGLTADALTAASTSALLALSGVVAQDFAFGDNSFGGGEQRMVSVVLNPGEEYYLGATPAMFDSTIRDVNFVCHGGRATIRGTGKGLVFDRIRNATFENINFVGFTTATEWDTDNVDGNLITYKNCWFIDCDLGVDTISHAASRSTVLVFDKCRTARTLKLVQSYCDMLIFNDCHFRNGDASGAFVFADSQVIINGGIWTPYEAGATARWIDADNRQSNETGSRSVTCNQVRFGPEQSGGIPLIYSWLNASGTGGTRTTMTHISINNCLSGCNSPLTPQALVVLMDNDAGTQSLAPNTISICGGSHNGASGVVATESGNPVANPVGAFVIDIDAAAQARWGDASNAPSTPLVETGLEKYVSGWSIENGESTATGTITVSVGSRRRIIMKQTAAATVTNLTDALDGHIVTLLFRNSNVTIQEATNGGSFDLSVGADFVGSARSTLTVQYDRATARWQEISRSVN